MDGFQTKTKFEERAAERLRADDGWIGQLHRLATAHSTINTTHTTHNCGKSFGRKQPCQTTPPPLCTHTVRPQNYLTWTYLNTQTVGPVQQQA